MSGAVMRMSGKEKSDNSIVRSLNRSVRRQNRTEIPLQMKERIEQVNQFKIAGGQEQVLSHELGDMVQQKLEMIRINGSKVEIAQRMSNNVVQRCGGKKKEGGNEDELREKAERARDGYVQKAQRKYWRAMGAYYKAMNDYRHYRRRYKPYHPTIPAVAIGAYDIVTGKVVFGFSGAPPHDINQELVDTVNDAKIGDIGKLGEGTNNIVGACAEFHAANKLLNRGSKIANIRFTAAVRPRTGQELPPCDNCEAMFGDNLSQ